MSPAPSESGDACPACGNPRDWRGVCAACVVAGALSTGEPENPVPTEDGVLSEFELLAELGRGGMGVVWRARQAKLDRVVAVKRLRSGLSGAGHERERFRREALAVARLSHPGIVALLEVGEDPEGPFLVLEYVCGESLAQRLRAGPLAPRAAAELVRQLAVAVQHAHDRGVLHRDLKPSNVLLDAARGDAPRLTDFGIARLGDDAGGTLTHSLAGLGSPCYAAPEQAGGGGVHSPATDVHGLGAVLFHCLTGRAPFVGEDPLAVFRAAMAEDPPPLRSLNPTVPRDLETLCLKCLEKEPGRRYASAADLADELDRYLRHEPLRARPVGRLGLGLRWCRRRPAVAGLLGALLLAIVTGGVSSEWLRRNAERARRSAEASRDESRLNLYAADVKLADQALGEGNALLARTLLQRHVPVVGAMDRRGLEWWLLSAAAGAGILRDCTNLPAGARSLAFSPEGDVVFAGDFAGDLWCWEWERALPARRMARLGLPVLALDVSPAGRELVLACQHPTAGTGAVTVVRRTDGAVLASWPAAAARVAFAPDGEHVVTALARFAEVTGGGSIEVHRWREGRRVGGVEDVGPRFALSRDGRRVVAGGRLVAPSGGPLVSEWSLLEFPSLRLLARHRAAGVVTGFQFLDADRLVFATANPELTHLWNPELNTSFSLITPGLGSPEQPVRVGGTSMVALAGAVHGVRLFEWTRDPLILRCRTNLVSDRGGLGALAAAPGRPWVAGAAGDGSLLVWDSRQPARETSRRLGGVASYRSATPLLAFDARGTRLAVREPDGTLAIHPLGPDAGATVSTLNLPGEELLGWAGDTGQLVTLSGTNEARFRSAQTGELLRRVGLAGAEGAGRLLELSQDGCWLAGCGPAGGCRVWHLVDGQCHPPQPGHAGRISAVHVDSTHQVFVTGGEDGSIALLELATGRQRWRVKASHMLLWCVRVSPDGRAVAAAGREGVVTLWDPADGRELGRFAGESSGIQWLDWTPDSQRLVTSGYQCVRIWHRPTGREVLRLPVPAQYLQAMVAPDGQTLVAVVDREVRMWPGASAGARTARQVDGVRTRP